jgi:hypothetical protein
LLQTRSQEESFDGEEMELSFLGVSSGGGSAFQNRLIPGALSNGKKPRSPHALRARFFATWFGQRVGLALVFLRQDIGAIACIIVKLDSTRE